MTFKYFSNSRNRPKDPRRFIIKKKGYGPNWSTQKKEVLERDKYSCQKCGYKGKKKWNNRWDVFVHHIRKIAYFADTGTGEVDYESANDLSNLITLCNFCHKAADGHAPLKGFEMLK